MIRIDDGRCYYRGAAKAQATASLEMLNISTGGCCILSSMIFFRGAVLELTIPFVDGRGPIVCSVRVAWSERGRQGKYVSGLYFLEIGEKDLERIKALLKLKS